MGNVTLLFGVFAASQEGMDLNSLLINIYFFIASLFLTPAAFLLSRFLNSPSGSLMYRIWLVALKVCMFLFVPITIVYFGASLFESLTRSLIRALDETVLINFFIFLPLQVLTYFSATITILVQRHKLIGRGLPPPSSRIWQGFALMLIASLVATGALVKGIMDF